MAVRLLNLEKFCNGDARCAEALTLCNRPDVNKAGFSFVDMDAFYWPLIERREFDEVIARREEVEAFARSIVTAQTAARTRETRAELVARMAIEGPGLWKQLHQRALESQALAVTEIAWLNNFAASLPCGECKHHWLELVAAHPPALATREDYFRWTVDRHNDVNRRLGKPAIELADARRIWCAGATSMEPMPSASTRA